LNSLQPYVQAMLDWARQMVVYTEEYRDQLTSEQEGLYSLWKEEMAAYIASVERLNRQDRIKELDAAKLEQLRKQSEQLYDRFLSIFKLQAQPLSKQKQKQEQQPVQPKEEVIRRTVPIGEHRLPPLPYDYAALEPYISAEIMRLHHDEHHRSYVEGLNRAERKMQEARLTGNYELLKHWQREAAFHGSGHYLHTIFWAIMSPEGGGRPTGELAQAINQTFGSFDRFKQHFSEAAKQAEGVGWAILVWSPRAQRLEILQTEKHQLFTQWDTIPLLVLDVWEHAYYLQYKADRERYIEQWWNVVNWPEVEKRYQQASRLRWTPY
jgi:Fe-Mn family superoxide dismutase